MKRTFQHKDLTNPLPNAELYEWLINYAKSKWVPVHEGTNKFYYKEYPRLAFISNEINGCGTNDLHGLNLITIEQFIEYCDNWEEVKGKAHLKLNEEYTAEINREKKQVLFSISFEKIDELHKMIHEQ